MRIPSIIGLFLGSLMSLFAQPDSLSIYKKQAQEQMDSLRLSQLQAVRMQAFDALEKTLLLALGQAGSFDLDLELEGLSELRPKDNAFRILSWQLYIDKDSYRYGGLLQKADGTCYSLQDKSEEVNPLLFAKLKPENWHGALYYNIREFEHKGKKKYLLFGLNSYSFLHRRKLLEVLHFGGPGGSPRFGERLIEIPDGRGGRRMVSRFVMQYSAAVSVSLNYSAEDNMIVYDHLVQGNPVPDAGPANVPDGSYCGLRLSKKGIWEYVDMAYEYNYDRRTSWDNPTAPMEDNPLFDKKRKERDIFGRRKQNPQSDKKVPFLGKER